MRYTYFGERDVQNNMSFEKQKTCIEMKKKTLESRLDSLDNTYHNKEHAQEVVENLKSYLDNLLDEGLFDESEKLLLIESAWRHDDGHSGTTYRQDVSDDNLSNEEYSVSLLKKDLGKALDSQSLKFIEDNILATSFGQNDKTKLSEDTQNYYRDYSPENDAQKLLALADVSGFMKGWEGWAEESLRLLEEMPENTPDDIDAWIKNREGFIKYYIYPLLKSVQDILDPQYVEKLKSELVVILSKLSSLEDESSTERKEYEEKLIQIRNSNLE